MVVELENLTGRRALVMGFGRFGGGLGVTKYLLECGAHVTVTDLSEESALAESIACLNDEQQKAITWKFGPHDPSDFTSAEIVVANPSVPTSDQNLVAARKSGAWVTTDIELFLRLTDMRLVLITGTQGKSSTAKMTADLLKSAGCDVHLGGNIGASLLPTLRSTHTPESIAVLELSSYQLEGLPDDVALARAQVVGITNLLEDHLARHQTLERYHRAKVRILDLLLEGGTAIIPLADLGNPPLQGEMANRLQKTHWMPFSAHSERAELSLSDGQFTRHGVAIAATSELALPGSFQQLNALVAIGVALALGISPEKVREAIPTLKGLPHRAQDLGLIANAPFAIRVIDNAVSTTPDSTQSVLESLPGPLTLLVGGRSKGQDLTRLAASCEGRVAHVLCFGEAAHELQKAFVSTVPSSTAFTKMEDALQSAIGAHASPTILFSPACSSFDAFSNFKQRALAFRSALGFSTEANS